MQRVREILLSGLLLWNIAPSTGLGNEGFRISDLPNGYAEGRVDAPYGAYNTPFAGRVKKYSDLLDTIEPKIYGLGLYSPNDEINQAKAVYFLEHILLGIHQKLSEENEVHTKFEYSSLQFRTQQLYRATRHHGERLYESMIRSVDKALPGPNGSQFRIENKNTELTLFLPNCRQEQCPTESERNLYYQTKLQEFEASGGSLSELKLLDSKFIQSLQGLSRVEYAERPDGSIWVTSGKAGHLLLAAGGPVRGAGQLVLIKNSSKNNQLSVLITSNASGTYKPDLLSANQLANRIAFDYSVPRGNITVTEGEPLGTQTIEVLAKAHGMDKATIKTMIEPIKVEAKSFFENPYLAFKERKSDSLHNISESPAKDSKCVTSLSRIPSSLNFLFLELCR